MSQLSIYLAGPITGCTYQGCTNWREAFGKLLHDINLKTCFEDPRTGALEVKFQPNLIQLLSPMRGKEYLADEAAIAKDYPKEVLSCSRGIMTRDHFDCTRCNLVIANLLGATIVSVGTVMEIAWAFDRRIPVIAVMEPGNLHEHPMVNEAIDYRVSTLRDAAHTALMVLWPGA